ncbi:MAG TPA: nucleoside triphosphate pyrophosphohydrolase [Ktedonobacteraceae bacterium]|nr:nucleoside triphosphate pyrophosphohydrolase [Ktedonobacteraceae bacterium]
MHTEYNKLVRDRIPAILAQAGYTYETIIMDEQEYQQALREKLVEEALEAAAATETRQLITELTDLYEVIDTLMRENTIAPEVVRAEQERRRQERGGFAQRIRLLSTTSSANTDTP